jgi:hypothetical protein
MADITVKKNDGTTDVTYTKKVASGGDKSPAVWRSDSVGTAPAFRPEFTATSQANGTKTARRVLTRYVYPGTVTDASGQTSVNNRLIIEVSAVVPQGMDDDDINEGVSQGLNLNASALIKSTLKEGFAPA